MGTEGNHLGGGSPGRRWTTLILILLSGIALHCRNGGQTEGMVPVSMESLTPALEAEILRLEDCRSLGDGRLVDLTGSGDDRVRERIALAHGRIGDPRSLESLLVLLEDPHIVVRRQAAFSLGLLADRRALPPLAHCLGDTDAEVRYLAAEALLRIGGGEMVSRVREELQREGDTTAGDDAGDQVHAILGNLWRLEGGGGLVTELHSRASADGGGTLKTRRAAVFSLSRLRLEESRSLLLSLLHDPDAGIRALAARGLPASPGSAKGRETAAALSRLLADEDDPLVLVESLAALGRTGHPVGEAVLLASLADPRGHPRLTAIQTAARLGAEMPAIRGRLADLASGVMDPAGSGTSSGTGPALRDAALEALARMGDDRSLAVGLTRSRSADPVERSAAAPLLAEYDTPQAREALRSLLSDNEARPVRAALTSIAARERSAEFREDLTRLLMAAESETVRAAAVEAFGALVERNGLDLPLALFRQECERNSLDPCFSLIDIFSRFPGEARVEQALRDALQTSRRLVRQRAAGVLRAWGRSDHIPAESCETAEPFPPLEHYERALSWAGDRLTATILTDQGEIRLELLHRDAPLTVLNFVDLAGKGYFDGLTFHRVVPGFVIQGGDPSGDGWGGPGHTIRCEINRLRYHRGMVGMALSGKDTGGSQFFITLSPQPHLDGRYTIFGRVLSGMEIVDRIQKGEVMKRVSVDALSDAAL